MNKIYLPSHKDCGNRGCEAITKGTAEILGVKKNRIIAYSNDIDSDRKVGLEEYVTLKGFNKRTILDKIKFRIKKALIYNSSDKQIYASGYKYEKILKQIKRDDLVLSTGGDMFCYQNNEVLYINNYLNKRGIKTILWGCSFGRENITPEKLDTLRTFKAIITRESLSEGVMKELGLKNVYRFPDPAFVLKAQKCKLPECVVNHDVIGINLSNFVRENISLDSEYGKNVESLFEYILSETNLHILLIPHVFWSDQDDRKISDMLYNRFRESQKVDMLKSENYNYCEIRYIISKCKFFVGARTHAMISAYATKVPALALGYSIKARGIAKDLGMDEYVVDWKKLCGDRHLVDAFNNMYNNETNIRKTYDTILNNYIKNAYKAKSIIHKIDAL